MDALLGRRLLGGPWPGGEEGRRAGFGEERREWYPRQATAAWGRCCAPGRWWCWRRRRRGTSAAVGAGRVMVMEGRRGQSGPPGPVNIRPSPQSSTKGRRFEGTPAGVEKASSEDCMAASSLIRWGGCAAVLGGLSTAFVGGFFPSHPSKSEGE